MKLPSTVVAALLMVGPANQSLSATQIDSPTDVILITIDTLRADYVGCYGSSQVETPVLDSLAKDGVLFDTAYCQVPLTPPSHASILAGLYPASHGLRDFTIGQYRPGTPSFATILKEQGYQTAAFVSAFVLDESWGLDEGFDLYYDNFEVDQQEGVNPGNIQRRASETIDRVLPWLERATGPFFLWVHLFDPHHDYDPPPPFSTLYSSNLYAGEVAYTDQQVGRLIAALKKAGIYDQALIITTSDHGESLGEHGENEHGFFLYESALRIPLIIKLPADYKVQNQRLGTIAQTVDLLPTTLQILRIRPEGSLAIEGRGLLSHILGKRKEEGLAYAETFYPLTSFGWSPLRVLRKGVHKYIEAPRPELYDVVADPQELKNLYMTQQPLAHQLRVQMLGVEQNFRPVTERATAMTGSESMERLNALGYVSVSQPIRVQNWNDLPDPKERIEIFNTILKGLQASEAGRFERSNQILNAVAEEHPEIFIIHYSIGLNYLKLGKPKQALELFGRAASLNPDFASIQVNRARALVDLGRHEEAREALEQVTEKGPTNLTAMRLLASLYSRGREFSAAVRLYRSILDRRKDDRQATKQLGIALVEMQSFEEGLKELNHSIELGLDDAQLRNSQGVALSNLNRPDEAIQSYRKALEMRPKYAQPRLNLAFTLLRSGKRHEAMQEFETLCRTSPKLCARYREKFQ